MTHEERINWYRNAGYGMMVHWGLYSLLGGEWKGRRISHNYAEWIMANQAIPIVEYEKLAQAFDPVFFVKVRVKVHQSIERTPKSAPAVELGKLVFVNLFGFAEKIISAAAQRLPPHLHNRCLSHRSAQIQMRRTDAWLLHFPDRMMYSMCLPLHPEMIEHSPKEGSVHPFRILFLEICDRS